MITNVITKREVPLTKLMYERTKVIKIFNDTLVRMKQQKVSITIPIKRSRDYYIIKAHIQEINQQEKLIQLLEKNIGHD